MKWMLIEPLEMDGVADIPPEKAFVLGVEWEAFRRRLGARIPFTALVHDENTSRLVGMAERENRFVEHHQAEPGWTVIVVGGNAD